ncbi:hypothetical protein GCM10010306_026000 [Streptomyces umbrinus]|uniref:OsmC family protein n=1 Tax=Streptomyces umbrinus TaxID=67370 RepID=UPI00167C3AF2|nr:OsmC family protein [Streptomyces umbrinus]GHB31699.1 hypothetical protein GCM10010306_026000 [Streptomyces umbrinus]
MPRTGVENTTPQPATPDEHRLEVTHIGGDTYAFEVRGHRMLVDQPANAGGHDSGPTPTELFAASLATCVALYAGRYVRRHGLDGVGLRVRSEFTMAGDRPARVGAVRITLTPPPGLSEQRRTALLAVASHCTVHNTLRQPPEIEIELEP